MAETIRWSVFACLSTIFLAPVAHAAGPGDAAKTLAAEIAGGVGQLGADAAVMVAPAQMPEGDSSARAFVEALEAALVSEHSVVVVDREAMKAALGEAALGASLSDANLRDVAGGIGAQGLISMDIAAVGGSYRANVRLVKVEDGTLVIAGKAEFGESGGGDDSSAESASLEIQLRRLSDKIAKGLDNVAGDMRYQRFAVMPFEETGATTKEKQLGLLVSAELTTMLRRDHNLVMVERAELTRILDELALGQTGVVDESQSVEVGKLAGAQALVIGSVGEAGDRYLVNAKVVSVSDGQVVVAEQSQLPAADLVALSSEAVVLRTTAGAVYRSLLLPGWGQLYNRQSVKASVFVGVEVLAIGAAVTYHVLGSAKQSDYEKLGPGEAGRYERLRDDAERNYTWRNVFVWGAVGIHALNILDAFLSGKTYDSPTLSVGSSSAAAAWEW